MSKLIKLAGKTYAGSLKNQTIGSAETDRDVLNNVLNVTITSTANKDGIIQYKGAIADMAAIKGIFDINPNIRFILDEIKYKNNTLNLKTISNEIKTQYHKNSENNQPFNETITQDQYDVKCEGYIIKTEQKLGVKIQKITLDSHNVITELDITNLEDVTKKAFAKLLNANPKDKPKIIQESKYELTKKYRSQSATTGIYDGQIEEDTPITQTQKTGITRASNIKSEHIRKGFKKTRTLKSGLVKEIAIAPTVIHLNEYTKEDLKDAGFSPQGEPTQEALILYRGKLNDKDLIALQNANNFKTMTEMYGAMTIGFNYKKLNDLFETYK